MSPLLILGGTTEAAALARALAAAFPGLDIITSLAGVLATVQDPLPPPGGEGRVRGDTPAVDTLTRLAAARHPLPQAGEGFLPGRVRVGGFGGAEGLAEYLKAEGVGAVIDATHPFAARISAHAEAACAAIGIPRLVLARPEWQAVAGDRWTRVADTAEAAARLPEFGCRAFLAVGSRDLAAFAGVAGVDLVIRLIAPAPPPIPGATVVVGRGPFRLEDELALLKEHAVEVVVSKAAGGDATYAKIAAARTLGLPVLLIRRPPPPSGPAVDSVAAAVGWVRDCTG